MTVTPSLDAAPLPPTFAGVGSCAGLPGEAETDFAALLARHPIAGPQRAAPPVPPSLVQLPSLPQQPPGLPQPSAALTPARAAPDDPAPGPDDDPAPADLPPALLVLPMAPIQAFALPPGLDPPQDAGDPGAGLATAASPAALPPVSAPALPVPVDGAAPDWGTQLAARLDGPAGAAAPPTELSLDLAPDHLGPLRLNIRMAEDDTRIAIAAATPEAARLLQDTAADLQRSLADAGFMLAGERAPQGDASAGRQPQPWPTPGPVPRTTDPAPPRGAAFPHSSPRRAGGLNLLA